MIVKEAWRKPVTLLAGLMLACSVTLAGVALAGPSPVIVGGVRPEGPAVSGSRVVWADRRNGNYDIYLYDDATRSTRRLTSDPADQIQPSISGDVVVWTDYRGADADIWCYDLSTSTERVLVSEAGDQVQPSVSADWLAWVDKPSGSPGTIHAMSLSGGSPVVVPCSGDCRSPVAAGNLVAWEAFPTASHPGNEVQAYDLVSGATYRFGTSLPELVPATDGRYIAWAQSNGRDLDVVAYDSATGRQITVGGGPGEQTLPAVAGGVAYWLDNVPGQRIHVDSYTFATGRSARFNDYGTGDVNGFAASGASATWLTNAGESFQVRAVLDASLGARMRSLARLAGLPSIASSLRLAQAASGDTKPPTVTATSVTRGQTRVARGAAIVVYFSEAIDPATVNGGTLRLLDVRTRRPVRARVRYSALARAATLKPVAPLAAASSFTLAVSPQVADAAGNTLADAPVVTFSTGEVVADAAIPSTPGNPRARVEGLSGVTLTWNASTDDVGVTEYDIYRSLTATPIVNWPADASLVTTVNGSTLTATFAKKSDETSKAYTHYYVVTAKDAIGNVSPPSANNAPDPHGTASSVGRTNTCTRCHSVHGATPGGALGAKSAASCYICHGSTPATRAYGYASTFDVQADFGDDTQIATTGPELASGRSIHRNTYMTAAQIECGVCHTPHRKPYDADPTLSFNRLLRTQLTTGPDTYRYNTDATATGNQFCADCHGYGSLTAMTIAGGDLAYNETAGDHLGASMATYTASAHGPSTVPTNSGETSRSPGIQCEACHNNHAAGTSKLIDYRSSNVTDAQNNQSGLCFKCHSASGQEAGKPNTWNGRDVKAEFQRASHHPSSVGGAASVTCANCHNAHVVQTGGSTFAWVAGRVVDPANTKVLWTGTPGEFCLRCHDGSPPVVQISASVDVPYAINFRTMSQYPLFTGWDKSSMRSSGHWDSTATGDHAVQCNKCHDPHGSDNARLVAGDNTHIFGPTNQRINTAAKGEENQCLSCHDWKSSTCNSAPGCHETAMADVAPAFALPASHPTKTYSGRHSDTETASNLGAGNRHAECVDCHDPHTVQRGAHTTGTAEAGPAVYGAVGVKPTWGGTKMSAPVTFTVQPLDGTSGDYESYLCFKCHSSYVNLTGINSPSGGFQETNIAAEFNPSNFSGHNVAGAVFARALTNPVDASTWQAPTTASLGLSGSWTATSTMTCSDCHAYSGSGARGPHGSANAFILKYGSASANWYASTMGSWGTSSTNFCAGCHTSDPHGSGWVIPSTTYHTSFPCEACHIRIPHGWKRPRLLGYRATDTLPYVDPSIAGLDGITGNVQTTPYNAVNYGQCTGSCASGIHTPGMPANAW